MIRGDMQETETQPFRRQVFFISGFDPRGALFLHKNTVTETEKWSEISGHPVKTGPRKNIGKLVRRWMIDADLPDGRAQTSFDFLQWDDIIRQHWDKRNWLVYLQSIAGLWRLFLDGVYTRTIRESWPIAIVMSARKSPPPSFVASMPSASAACRIHCRSIRRGWMYCFSEFAPSAL